ncbi:MAG: hypothetical protein CVT48_00385 [Thermoplasmata archaeon HGW-Thermoplasmata-1]|nr:MAG: hypothetical protein CVT48_00385 [Thermoplasmata archaeon HGW-Thermoplasmata-1]
MEDRMETRKVQLTGGSTYTISLPKKWTELANIKNGDALGVLPQEDGSILIFPKDSKKKEKRSISLKVESDDKEEIVRRMIGAYLAGYTEILLTSKERFSPEMRQAIRQITYTLIGPEMVDESADSVTIQDFLDPSEFPFKKGIRRMYLIARAMQKDAVTALRERDCQLATDVQGRDDEVDRLYWLIAKQYNTLLIDMGFAKRMETTSVEALDYLLVARTLERIGDHAKNIAKHVEIIIEKTAGCGGEMSLLLQKVAGFSDSVLSLLDDSMTSFISKSFELANETICKAKSIAAVNKFLMDDVVTHGDNGRLTVSLSYMMASLNRTRHYVIDIAEITINHILSTQ